MEPTGHPLAPESSESLAGDLAPLAQALGASEALASLTALARLVEAPTPDSLPAWRAFLERYRERWLSSVELPAVREAYELALRGESRQLLELDRRLGRQFGQSAFAEASRHTGRLQLRRLRPLRDRTLQHYLRAVEEGRATGWHVIVFGVLLAVFSLPLRQGLLHYAVKTQHSLLDSASLGVGMTHPERSRLQEECAAPAASAIQRLLPAFQPRPA